MQILDAIGVIQTHTADRVFRPDISVRREALMEVESMLADKADRQILAHGPAGSGKTTWVCQFAKARLDSGRSVAFIRIDDNVSENSARCDDVVSELKRAAERSADGRIIAIIDDAAGRSGSDPAFRAALRLAEASFAEPSVRVLIALRTDMLSAFLDRNANVPSDRVFREVLLEPFTSYEVQEVAKQMSKASPESARARLRAAEALADSRDTTSLIPALAVSFLDSIEGTSFAGDVSRFKIYSRLFANRVLGLATPSIGIRKSRLLKRLAATLLKRGHTSIALDATSEPLVPIFDTSGTLVDECIQLIADRVLERHVDDFGVRLAFVDQDFFAFVAAIAIDEATSADVADLLRRSETFPPAQRVAAFLVARLISHDSLNAAEIHRCLGPNALDLLPMLGEFDADSFLQLLPQLAKSNPAKALGVVHELLVGRFSRSAARGAELLTGILPPPHRDAAKRVWAKALVATEDLARAATLLEQLSSPPDPEIWYLLGEVAIARRRLDEAQAWYENLSKLESIDDRARANALHGLGDVVGTRGNHSKAITMIRKAIRLYPKDPPSKDLAEAWGDLGEFLTEARRFDEAHKALDESYRLNDRLSNFYPGMTIVQGLRGFLALREGDLDAAEQLLERCREAVHKLGFRWREAWCFDRLSELASAHHDTDEAARLNRESEKLFREIAGEPEKPN